MDIMSPLALDAKAIKQAPLAPPSPALHRQATSSAQSPTIDESGNQAEPVDIPDHLTNAEISPQPSPRQPPPAHAGPN